MKPGFETLTKTRRAEAVPDRRVAVPKRRDWNGQEAEPGNRHRRGRSFEQRIRDYTSGCADLWAMGSPDTPGLGPVVPRGEQAIRERETDRCIQAIERRLRAYPGTGAERTIWREDFLRTLHAMATECLGFSEAGLKLFFNRTAMNATRQFIRDARAFDAALSEASVFQALRNLWVIHNAQLFLASPIALSPAGFGYSMLYPWTDNYLDDPRIPDRSKAAFGDWLERRLTGGQVTAPDAHAAQVGQLVGFIEESFSRADCPEVYLSLRAIHGAQMASLRQQQAGADDPAILAITFQKGGTSVLTDAYLVRGWLHEAEAEFMFGYGVLLQLMDDLQDLRADLANRHATIFTRRAASAPLDEVTSRLWAFTHAVLWPSGRLAAPQFDPLKALIQENCKLLLLQAVARNREFYSDGFTAEMELCSPFRFGYLRRRKATLADKCARLAGVPAPPTTRARLDLGYLGIEL